MCHRADGKIDFGNAIVPFKTMKVKHIAQLTLIAIGQLWGMNNLKIEKTTGMSLIIQRKHSSIPITNF